MIPFSLYAGVYLLLQKDNKVLLLRRHSKRWISAYGKYILVAGYVDGNESIFDTAIREAKEEIRIKISKKDLKLVHVMHRKSDDGTEYIDFFIRCNKWKGTPINAEPSEHDDMRWASINRLSADTLPNVKNAIRHIADKVFFSEYGV